MAEDNNYDPGAWAGHDFAGARAAYATRASTVAAQQVRVPIASLIPERLSTLSYSPAVVMVDGTGSFGSWPGIIWEKLPYLDVEGKSYLGADMEISFACNGDFYDNWPFRPRPFDKGPALKEHLLQLPVEGGGSGPMSGYECYEVGALYYARNVDMPNAVKPIFIFVADERPHPTLTVANAAKHKIIISQDMSVDEIFNELKQKFSVYLIYKSYSPESRAEWVRLLGEDHVVDLEDPARIVDVIFGIFARETGRIEYFRSEVEGRQTPEQVATVYKALKTVHRNLPAVAAGNSTMHRPSGGVPTKSLL